MGKTNWSRVFLGGLLAGVVFSILGWITSSIYLEKLWDSALEGLKHPIQESAGMMIFWVVLSLVSGILAVWLYSAIRPRYGAGSRTALLAGLSFWILGGLFPALAYGSMDLFPAKVLVIDTLTYLVITVVGTLLGAWVYKEE